MERGIARLAAGTRRTDLSRWARVERLTQFVACLLGVAAAVAVAWGTLRVRAAEDGRALPVVDGLLLVTVLSRELTLVKRNVADCTGRWVSVFDPWGRVLYE